jgi:hypothetical protein
MRCLSIAFCLALAVLTCGLATDAQHVRLRSQITPDCPAAPGSNENWKFSDIYADGNIAVQGSYNCRGAFIYDITNPDAPVLASWYNAPRPGANPPFHTFLEAIVIGNRGYFGTGTGGGVHILDLSDPYHPVLLGIVDPDHGNAFSAVHEMVVFEQNGARILVENFNCLGCTKVLKFINVTDPANPVFIRDLVPTEPRWVHAIHIRGNRMFTSGWGNGGAARGRTEIYDISNIALQPPALLGFIEDPNSNADAGNQMHSSWSSEDGNYLYSCREITNSNGPTPGDLRVYDIHNPSQPLLVNSISMAGLGLNAITPHNPVVMGNYLYVSWYQAGVQVFDLTNPVSPQRVGQYDTFQPTFAPPAEKTREARAQKRRLADREPWDIVCGGENVQSSLPSEYDGNWAVFPFLGQDKVLAGDMLSGLMVLDASGVAMPLKNRVADFDGDRRTDLSVLRPSTGEWEIEGTSGPTSTSRVRMGTTGDQVVAGDYDGDGNAELATFTPGTAHWTIRRHFARQVYFSGQYGLPGDVAVPADYDADGRTDIAVWRPSDGSWHIRRSTLGETTATLGTFGDKPVTGDYDGDGKADISTWHPSDGLWTFRQSSSSLTFSFGLGQTGDKPLSADFDGNGVTDLVVYRPSNGTWYIHDPVTGSATSYIWGGPNDIPIPADYDGDGKADLCVFRPSTNEWLRVNSSNGAVVVRTFGQPGDVPVPISIQPQ